MKRTNPLSDARHSFGQSVSTTNKETKASALWHRKSGAGYALFIQYYSGQPSGVVVDTIECSSNMNESTSDRGVGGSRAAKKRRRNKLKMNPSLIVDDSCVSTKHEEPKQTNHLSFSSELLQVFHNIPTGHHLKEFIACLCQPLPITFRIRQLHEVNIVQRLPTFLQQLSQHNTHIQPISLDCSSTKSNLYQSSPSISKDNLKMQVPDLHHLLLEASTSGLIARQDTGSMLPIFALSTLGYMTMGSRVLDLCASPGSKTMQALEVITSSVDIILAKKLGRIVSNDINPQRLLTLQEAVERSGIPPILLKRVVYTNFDACTFPTPKSGKLFDCVVADVPCSGDGTIRKDKTILPGWMPSIANSLHSIQLSILKRALELTRVGGVVAYSTCSLNPIENEAVVAAALQWAHQANSSISLVDWPNHIFPHLKRRPGVSCWRVADHDAHTVHNPQVLEDDEDKEANLIWHDSFEQASKHHHLPQTLWPQQEYENYSLNKCIRLWPQDQNTGGFFLALLRKNNDIQ